MHTPSRSDSTQATRTAPVIDRLLDDAMLLSMKNKTIVWGIIIIIILIAGYWYFEMKGGQKMTADTTIAQVAATDTFGTYPYECDEHVMMSMTPSSDMSTIKIAGTNGAAYPAAVTLSKVTASSGVRYEGGGYVLTGKGESVAIIQGGQTLNCSPVPNPDAAPLNFGD
jgi:membrane-bound inhibitor of C-type lysozyme